MDLAYLQKLIMSIWQEGPILTGWSFCLKRIFNTSIGWLSDYYSIESIFLGIFISELLLQPRFFFTFKQFFSTSFEDFGKNE